MVEKREEMRKRRIIRRKREKERKGQAGFKNVRRYSIIKGRIRTAGVKEEKMEWGEEKDEQKKLRN